MPQCPDATHRHVSASGASPKFSTTKRNTTHPRRRFKDEKWRGSCGNNKCQKNHTRAVRRPSAHAHDSNTRSLSCVWAACRSQRWTLTIGVPRVSVWHYFLPSMVKHTASTDKKKSCLLLVCSVNKKVFQMGLWSWTGL